MLCYAMLCILSSCSKEKPFLRIGESFQANQAYLKSQQPLLSMSYDVEVFDKLTQIGIGESSFPDLDMVACTPSRTRQLVTMQLMADGSSNWIIESLTPQNPIIIPHKTLANTSIPETKKTIISGNHVLLYDENDNQIYDFEVQMPLMTDLVNQIQSIEGQYSADFINQQLIGRQTQNFVQHLDDYIQNAPQNNIIISYHPNGLISAKEPLSNNSTPIANPGDYAIHIIDYSRNLLLATGVYDAQENMKTCIMFLYQSGPNAYLQAIRLEAAEELPSGLTGIRETITEFNNLNISVNY